MSGPIYIWVPNWDGPKGFQHYKNRDPKWIKCYTRLLNHEAYTELTFTQRGLLHGIWLEYASSTRRLRGDTTTLTRRLGQKVLKRDIETLCLVGFIELIASDVLAERLQNASPEVETEEEKETELENSSSSREETVPAPEPEANYAADPNADIDFDRNGAGAGTDPEERERGLPRRDLERINPHAILETIE